MSDLHEFYAVTLTSIYRVRDARDEYGWPMVEKIGRRARSYLPIGGRLENGYFVGIRKSGLVLYHTEVTLTGGSEDRARPEEVSRYLWGTSTSKIVALFLTEREARDCLAAVDRQGCDARWRAQTEAVLAAIGDDHPVFILSVDDPITFP